VKRLWLFVLVAVFVATIAPLVAAAYGVAWAAVLVYVWTVWRRLAKVERELADVSRRLEPGERR
jgi:CcmD family protein